MREPEISAVSEITNRARRLKACTGLLVNAVHSPNNVGSLAVCATRLTATKRKNAQTIVLVVVVVLVVVLVLVIENGEFEDEDEDEEDIGFMFYFPEMLFASRIMVSSCAGRWSAP